MAKDRIIETIGETRLLLPDLIVRALSANDRVKYLLTLLQTAGAAADGASEAISLQLERLDCGIEDAGLDLVVASSIREPDGCYRIPGARELVARIADEVRTMLVPLRVGDVPRASELERRAGAVSAELSIDGDLVSADDLDRLTHGPGQRGDSLHIVIMDAHRELNRLEETVATESIDGARVHGLAERDRAVVHAFMRGVHSTERLKLDHPGLATIATRNASALVIQNDLGTTDAHVVVIRIIDRMVTITYTDVHLARLVFFQDLLDRYEVVWEDTRSRNDRAIEGGLFHLATGRYRGGSDAMVQEFIEHLGSRLVFMIDWNRVRKRLRRLVGRGAAIRLLRWAADREYGHLPFLYAGADGLIYDALEFAGGRPARAGDSLQVLLGANSAEAYLQAVLRICSEGLASGKTVSLVQDVVRAELTGYLRSARQEIEELALRHAELCVEIAEAAREGLEQAIASATSRRDHTAARAREAEHHADALLTEARSAVGRSPDLAPYGALLEAADDIADCAEEATFYITLLSSGQPEDTVRTNVRRIASLVLEASREYLRAVQLSFDLRRGAPREDMDAFLAAAHRAIELEHETDDAQRAVHRALVSGGEQSSRALFVVVELTRAFEEAADALMHSAHLLLEHTLARVARSEATARRTQEAPPSAAPSGAAAAGEDIYVVGDPSGTVPDPFVIGAKAHGLARLARAGFRVPQAVVLKTSLSRRWMRSGLREDELAQVLSCATGALERTTGLHFGSTRRPLLVSVRSGAPTSMPGMLDTVLNVGLCDASVSGLIAASGNPKLAWDSYRRLVECFGTVVHGCPREPFNRALQERLDAEGARAPRELTTRGLQQLARVQLEVFADLTGAPFPQDPLEQLAAAVGGVLASWEAPRAREYRRMHDIARDLGTAVILQRMVFGNAGGISGAGVGFTRDPALGRPEMYLDFLLDAQGEDIVGGRINLDQGEALAQLTPEIRGELEQLCPRLEAEFGDTQEFEFTVQDRELFLLQTRPSKRTPWAALRIAVDQVHEGVISRQVAISHLDPIDLDAIRRVHVRAADGAAPIARAVPASVGVATGPLALDSEAVTRFAQAGVAPVLVRAETVTDDVAAVQLSAGVLTGAGGRTSHAAVVARELGKPCLVGCAGLKLDLTARTARIGDRVLREGDVICLDAESGLVFSGTPAVTEERPTEALGEVAAWRAELSASHAPQ
jgi:pyruvate, orthophosphate dikinase